MRYDVVIIGGSLAGAACARSLARMGIDAIALEKDTFPRPKVCGGFLSPNAVNCLDGLGLLERVRRRGAVQVDHASIHVEGARFDVPFQRAGLGISRSALDCVLAEGAPVEEDRTVKEVCEQGNGFRIKTEKGDIEARVVIDAAGKLSRFTRRLAEPEFGIQYFDPQARGSSMDFWFFRDGYGGAVTVEGDRSNFCFLIRKDALPRYVSKPGRLVTGPLAYARVPGTVIAIGDAAGMIDPFCGEGMHHALHSGILAARVVAEGLHGGRTYAQMKRAYDLESSKRWSGKRLLLQAMRRAIRHPEALKIGLRWNPRWFLDRLWATIPS